MNFQTQSNKKHRVRGYEGQERTWNRDFENAKKKMRSYDIIIDEDLKQRFANYLKACKANAIEVVLVYAPVYIEGQEFIQNEAILKETYSSFAKACDFKFLDFTNDEICYEKAYFYNTRHLNKVGAELFTKKLASLIKSYY
jgi:hypothetical protein